MPGGVCHRVRHEDADHTQMACLALRARMQVSACDALPEVRQRFGFRTRYRLDWAVERDTYLHQLAQWSITGQSLQFSNVCAQVRMARAAGWRR